MSDERTSAYAQFPGYRVDLEPHAGTMRARCGGVVVAESAHALVVRETKHAPRVYFPRGDVRMEYLEETAHRTHCPFKGDARYWSIRVGDRTCENAAWSYDAPVPEVRGLEGYVAFYGELAGDELEIAAPA